MKFFSAAIYQVLKLLVFLYTRIFYSKFTVINKEILQFKNPAIVVSNHPSTLLDPLNVGVGVSKQVYFLANAGLFSNPVAGAILNRYCIPIERPKDVGGRRIKNDHNFVRADIHLSKGRCLYIAPEGTSVVERRIRPLKTGTARIALSAENKNNFNLGLTIIPVGLNYSNPLEFQSKVLLNVGTPIHPKDYQEAYRKNPFHAAKKLTADLQAQMESLVLHTEEETLDQLLVRIEAILKSEAPLLAKERFLRAQKVLRHLKSMDSKDLEHLKIVAKQYFAALEKENLNDLSFFRSTEIRYGFLNILKLVLGFPLFLYGWINNFLGFFIPGFIAKKIKIYPGYKSTVMVLSGLILIPLVYFFQTKFISHFVDFQYSGWIYLLTLLPAGWFAWRYRIFVLQFFKDLKAKRFKAENSESFADLKSKRDKLLSSVKVD